MSQNRSESATPLPLELTSLIESLLFVADGPVPIHHLATATEVTPPDIIAALEQLESLYANRGLRLQRHNDHVQLTTAPEAAQAIGVFLGLDSVQRLSRPALEALAVIAYQQPVTRPQIDAVRGVSSDSVIKRLLALGLILEVGRAAGPGRPILYGTTPEFLQRFGLASLEELPLLNLQSPTTAAEAVPPAAGVTLDVERLAAKTGADGAFARAGQQPKVKSGDPQTERAAAAAESSARGGRTETPARVLAASYPEAELVWQPLQEVEETHSPNERDQSADQPSAPVRGAGAESDEQPPSADDASSRS